MGPFISHSGVRFIWMHVCNAVCTDLDLLVLPFIPVGSVQPLLVGLWCCCRILSGWRQLSSFWCISYNVQVQARERQHQFFLVVQQLTKICLKFFVAKFHCSCLNFKMSCSDFFFSKLKGRVSYSPCVFWAIHLYVKLEAVLKYASSSSFINLVNWLVSEVHQTDLNNLRIDVAVLLVGSINCWIDDWENS